MGDARGERGPVRCRGRATCSSSGLYDYNAELPFSDDYSPQAFRAERFTPYMPEQLVGLAMRHEPQWVPGPDESRWSYSNTNYVLAGMVVEAVTDNPWQQEVHDRIIEPLGLDHTYNPGTAAYLPEPAWRATPGSQAARNSSTLRCSDRVGRTPRGTWSAPPET